LNILFLSHRIPYPPNKGDKIRSFNEIKYLSKNNSIYLGTIYDSIHDLKQIGKLKRYCKEIRPFYLNKYSMLLKSLFLRKPFSVSYFYNRGLQKYVDSLIAKGRIDVVICYCSSMAEYIFQSQFYKKGKLDKINLIIDYVDLDSDKWKQYSKYTKNYKRVIFNIEHKRLLRYEMKINKAFDHSVFVANREIKAFKSKFPHTRNFKIIPNGVDQEYFKNKFHYTIRLKENKRNTNIVFTGVMNYFANEDGVNWFCKEIFPLVLKERPDSLFYIIGNNPSNFVKRLGRERNTVVTGYVDNILKYYLMADVCVIPLRIARGLQNKVIEAMATGNAVVATSNASNGIICENNKNILIADDKERFAKKVLELLDDKEKIRRF